MMAEIGMNFAHEEKSNQQLYIIRQLRFMQPGVSINFFLTVLNSACGWGMQSVPLQDVWSTIASPVLHKECKVETQNKLCWFGMMS